MKNNQNLFSLLFSFALLLFLASCTQTTTESEPAPERIKNTLKSVSLFQDTVGVDPAEVYALLEVVNKAIDSIGYPDAGYKMWEVNGADTLDFRYMVEGYWPDQATYDEIHGNELYKNAFDTEDPAFEAMVNIWYHRFNRIK